MQHAIRLNTAFLIYNTNIIAVIAFGLLIGNELYSLKNTLQTNAHYRESLFHRLIAHQSIIIIAPRITLLN